MPAERVTSFSPWHVVLLLDDSDQAQGQVSADLNEVAREILAEMDVASKGSKPYFKVTAIAYGAGATVLEECKDAREIDEDRVASLSGSDGRAHLAGALSAAREILERSPAASTDFRPYVFVLSGGGVDEDRAALLRAASALKRARTASGAPKVAVISLGDTDEKLMGAVASRPELSRRMQDLESFLGLFPPIGTVAGYSQNGEQEIDDIIMNL